jgi:hypothetical protein
MKVVSSQWSVISNIVFHLALCAMLLAVCVSGHAQQPKKVPQIGYLSAIDQATESIRIEAIRRALSKLGYIEGQNLVTHYRYAGDNRRGSGNPGGQKCDPGDSDRNGRRRI